MTIKEKPFFDAAFQSGHLPAFFFSNPFVAGFLAVIMAAIFGAVAALFLIAFFSSGDALELFSAARWGAIIAVVISAFSLLGIAVSALFQWEEARARLLFVLGGGVGIGLLIIVDLSASEAIRDWLEPVGRIL